MEKEPCPKSETRTIYIDENGLEISKSEFESRRINKLTDEELDWKRLELEAMLMIVEAECRRRGLE